MDFNSVNPKLTKLAELLKMSNPTPSHGYTISEAGPEIVTAPGVYFPSEKGEVIPLQSRAEGGPVSPNSSDTEKEKLGYFVTLSLKSNHVKEPNPDNLVVLYLPTINLPLWIR